MRQDCFGNPVTTSRDDTLQGINDFAGGFVGYQDRAVNALAAAEADPDCCILNAYAGFLWMFLEAPEAPQKARPFVARALAAKAGATPREALCADIADAWMRGDLDRTLALGESLLSSYPRDVTMAKFQQYHQFNLGDLPGMLRTALQVYDTNRDVAAMHSMVAFGYEECHLLEDAEKAARAALAIDPAEPWAHHAMAHVFLTKGRIEEGIAFLESVSKTWDGLNSFMYTHNWWHLALFYLSRGRMDDALAAYDHHVWGVAKDYSQDQVGAVSLLARIEFAGGDVGNRWAEPADLIAARGVDTVQPFLTMQYLYALGRAGRPEAEHLMAGVRYHAANSPLSSREAWAEVALPACEGILAFTRGDYNTAASRLVAALPRFVETGGSHAQRDLFEQIYLQALISSGRLIAAQQMLELRRGFDPDGVPLNLSLANVYDRLGLTTLSREARSRAERTLRTQPVRRRTDV